VNAAQRNARDAFAQSQKELETNMETRIASVREQEASLREELEKQHLATIANFETQLNSMVEQHVRESVQRAQETQLKQQQLQQSHEQSLMACLFALTS